MNNRADVFEETYRYYLSRLRQLSFDSLADTLGVGLEGGSMKVPFFQNIYRVSEKEIVDQSGKKPPHDICVILSNYILMCPAETPLGGGWAHYRDLKNSGPLTAYFANDVEHAVEKFFSGKPGALKKAADALRGSYPELDVDCDVAVQFYALPRIPVLLLYNDEDEEFPAKCSVLFESGAEHYLDAESLAMLGWQLFNNLRNEAHKLGEA